jgi:hypothetical protein
MVRKIQSVAQLPISPTTMLELEVVLPNGKVVKTGSNAYNSTSQIESYLRSAQNWAEGLIQ